MHVYDINGFILIWHNNYLVIFVEYNISFHQSCDVKYY